MINRGIFSVHYTATPPASAVSSATATGTADIKTWIIEEDPVSISGTVRWYMPFIGDVGMDDLIKEFNEIYPNIEVILTTYNNNADGNLSVNSAIMAGQVDVLQSFGLNQVYKRWAGGLE